MKVFISQPMNGIEDSEVLRIREEVIKKFKEKYDDVEILQTFIHEDAPKDSVIGLWYLGKSIQKLSQADAIYFIEGWEKARGCIIENLIANLYGIEILKD